MAAIKNFEPIAIVGLACSFPQANSISEFWKNLLLRQDCITRPKILNDGNGVFARGIISDVYAFDANFFGISSEDARTMDPQLRHALECTYHAMEDSGIVDSQQDGSISIFTSSAPSHYLTSDKWIKNDTPSRALKIRLFNDPEFIASYIAYKLGFTGRAVAVQSACSSSLVAVDFACVELQRGTSDICFITAVNISLPQDAGYTQQPGMIFSPSGRCLPFCDDADGTVPSNGVASVCLMTLSKALESNRRIYAIINGSAVNNDGAARAGYAAPSPLGQESVIRAALHAASIAPSQVKYIEAHGTGTLIGDRIELDALEEVFRFEIGDPYRVGIGSVKENIGHLFHAAGLASLIKISLSYWNGFVPQSSTIQYTSKLFRNNPNSFFRLSEALELKSNAESYCGISSFGIGGTNCHMIFSGWPRRDSVSIPQMNQLFPLLLSARSAEALYEQTINLARFLQQSPDILISELSHTYVQCRSHLNFRWGVLVGSIDTLITQLQQTKSRGSAVGFVQEASADGKAIESENFQRLDAWLNGRDVRWPICAEFEQALVNVPPYPFQKLLFRTIDDENSKFPEETQTNLWSSGWEVSDICAFSKQTPLSSPSDVFVLQMGTSLENTIFEIFKSSSVFRLFLDCSEFLEFLKGNQEEKYSAKTFRVVFLWDSIEKDNSPDAQSFFEVICWVAKNNLQCNLTLLDAVGEQFMSTGFSKNPIIDGIFAATRALVQENNEINVSCVTICKNNSVGIIQGHLASLIFNIRTSSVSNSFAEIVLANDKIYTRSFKAVNQHELVSSYREIKQKGLYVVLGGTGLLGSEISRGLLKKPGSIVAILSRNAPSAQWLSECGDESLRRMYHFKTDLASIEETKAIFSHIERSLGVLIDGVIHSADNVYSDSFSSFAKSTPELILATHQAKISATIAIKEYFRNRQPDFVVIFSSISSYLGGLRFGSYIFANRYCEAIVQDAWAQNCSNWLSMGWDTVGFDATRGARGNLETCLTEADVWPIFCKALKIPQPIIMVSKSNFISRLKSCMSALSSRSKCDSDSQSENLIERKNIDAFIFTLIRNKASTTNFDLETNLFSLGLDSLDILNLLEEIEVSTGTEIGWEKMLEVPTISTILSTFYSEK